MRSGPLPHLLNLISLRPPITGLQHSDVLAIPETYQNVFLPPSFALTSLFSLPIYCFLAHPALCSNIISWEKLPNHPFSKMMAPSPLFLSLPCFIYLFFYSAV